MRVAWIGLGVMGRSMAGHVLGAGHDLVVHTRTRATGDDLVARGARWADTPADAASGADAVAVMVGYPDDVREVVLGGRGALGAMAPGSLLIDLTTSEPSLAIEIEHAATERGIDSLDAPVSGGDVGARDATLSIMVGGTDVAFGRAMPLLELMGTTIVHQGPAGAGQRTKLVNQILVAGTMIGMSEALLYAREVGLDAEQVLASVGGGAAASWALQNLAPRVVGGDLAPGFYVEHFVKDLGIAVRDADSRGLDLPGLSLARRLYTELENQGGARLGTQALVAALADLNGRVWP